MDNFDVVVVGGGMVGAATAVGFAQQGRTVALVEGHAPSAFEHQQPMDLRVSAISHTSVELLDALCSWELIKTMRVCPYSELETWEQPQGRIHFNADEVKLEQLGYIVENRVIQLGLWQECSHRPQIEIICPDTLETISGSIVTLSSGRALSAQLIVGADGANSNVREQAKIGITAWDYRQHCMLINVETEQPQQPITWQWFTPSGPRSFLPLQGHQASLVWYDSPQRIRELSGLNPKQLRQEILIHFPDRLGDIKVVNHGAFPLVRRHAQSYSSENCVLVGDAAHTINPLAGQGVNLGFKDVACLLKELDGVAFEDKHAFDKGLARYGSKRRVDNLLMQTAMDVFYKGFSNELTPVKFARNLALLAADKSGPLKKQALKYALGM